MQIDDLWHSGSEIDWEAALEPYWMLVNATAPEDVLPGSVGSCRPSRTWPFPSQSLPLMVASARPMGGRVGKAAMLMAAALRLQRAPSRS